MSKLKYILIFLIITLAAINTILYFAVVELEEAVVSPEPIQMEEVLPDEAIVTGACTFGDCPVAVNLSKPYKTLQEDCEVETLQNLATTSQPEPVKESLTTELVSETYTLMESESDEATEPVATEVEEAPEPEEAPETSDRTVRCFVTAYCGCESCSGEFGPYTCFGTPCRANHTVAVDPDFIPYWTQLEINGIVYTAEDRGSAVNGWEIDIYFPEHWQTEAWNTGYYDVTIY